MNLILLLILNISLCVSGIQAISAEEIWNKGVLKGKQVVETIQNSRKAQIAVGLVLVVLLKRLLKKKKPSRSFLNYDNETDAGGSDVTRHYRFQDGGRPVTTSSNSDGLLDETGDCYGLNYPVNKPLELLGS